MPAHDVLTEGPALAVVQDDAVALRAARAEIEVLRSRVRELEQRVAAVTDIVTGLATLAEP